MYLLPMPKVLEIKTGRIKTKKVNINNECSDPRIEKALKFFETAADGMNFNLISLEKDGEGYTLDITDNGISIVGESTAGVFYGIQTLKQIFDNKEICCVHIEDKPDMKYRGYYHDVTRGKVPTLETLKKLVDTLAYYKMNSLQLYIEHTFPFKELGNLVEKTGCITPEEIRALDDYCYDNFIEFIPSIACFGHLFELLNLDKYKHLQVADNYAPNYYLWCERQLHHTIDPTKDESFEIIKSLIDQTIPLYRTNKFNICCDETFDLKTGKYRDMDTGKLYVEFVNKIIAYLESRGKQAMMWGDILLQQPETIKELPKTVEFLNWDYSDNPKEETFKTFSDLGTTQIVCPGTVSWARVTEAVGVSNENIVKSLDLAYKYNAKGMLNTNWGDYGNPCSLELAMHGTVLGAAKSWNIETENDEFFEKAICNLMYKNDKMVEYLSVLDKAQGKIEWHVLSKYYHLTYFTDKSKVPCPAEEDILISINLAKTVVDEISGEEWEKDNFRTELLSAAEGIIVMAELFAKIGGYNTERISDTYKWLETYRKNWLKANKESELYVIENMFTALEKKYNS